MNRIFNRTTFIACGVTFFAGLMFGSAASASDTSSIAVNDTRETHSDETHDEGMHGDHVGETPEEHAEHSDHVEHMEVTGSDSHAGEGYFELLTDSAHFLVELTYEFAFFLLSTAVLWWKLKRRDEKHGHDEGAAHTH